MPMEKKSGEDKNTFISRCIKHYIDKGRSQEQATAICESVWSTFERNEYFKDVINRLRAIKGKKKKC